MARLGYAILAVSDMTRSVAFYRTLLGLEPTFSSDEWTEFNTGPTSFALHKCGPGNGVPSGQHPAGTSWIAFTVDDIHEFHRHASGLGTPCAQQPADEGWGINATYRDPDGFEFNVAQAKAHA